MNSIFANWHRVSDSIDIKEQQIEDSIQEVTIKQHTEADSLDQLKNEGQAKEIKVHLKRERSGNHLQNEISKSENNEEITDNSFDTLLESNHECRDIFKRISSYETLSHHRFNSIPDIDTISRLLQSIPEPCKTIIDEHSNSLSFLKIETLNSDSGSITLKSVINRLPLYSWLLQGYSNLEIGEDSERVSIRRSVQASCDKGLAGVVVPVLKYVLGIRNHFKFLKVEMKITIKY